MSSDGSGAGNSAGVGEKPPTTTVRTRTVEPPAQRKKVGVIRISVPARDAGGAEPGRVVDTGHGISPGSDAGPAVPVPGAGPGSASGLDEKPVPSGSSSATVDVSRYAQDVSGYGHDVSGYTQDVSGYAQDVDGRDEGGRHSGAVYGTPTGEARYGAYEDEWTDTDSQGFQRSRPLHPSGWSDRPAQDPWAEQAVEAPRTPAPRDDLTDTMGWGDQAAWGAGVHAALNAAPAGNWGDETEWGDRTAWEGQTGRHDEQYGDQNDGQYQAAQYQATQYVAGQDQAAQYDAGQYEAGQDEAGRYQAGQYRGERYQGGQYEAAQYQGGQYHGGQYQAAAYQAAEPRAGYQAPSQPVGDWDDETGFGDQAAWSRSAYGSRSAWDPYGEWVADAPNYVSDYTGENTRGSVAYGAAERDQAARDLAARGEAYRAGGDHGYGYGQQSYGQQGYGRQSYEDQRNGDQRYGDDSGHGGDEPARHGAAGEHRRYEDGDGRPLNRDAGGGRHSRQQPPGRRRSEDGDGDGTTSGHFPVGGRHAERQWRSEDDLARPRAGGANQGRFA